MAASHSVGVSSIQSQTPLLSRVHKGGVQFFRLPHFRRTNVLIRSVELSPMRLAFPSKLLLSRDFFTRSLPRWAERENKITFCRMLKVENVLRFRSGYVLPLFSRVSSGVVVCKLLLSAKLQNDTISLSATPINRRCGFFFRKVSPLSQRVKVRRVDYCGYPRPSTNLFRDARRNCSSQCST